MTTINTLIPEHLGDLGTDASAARAREILREMGLDANAEITDARWDVMLDTLSRELYA